MCWEIKIGFIAANPNTGPAASKHHVMAQAICSSLFGNDGNCAIKFWCGDIKLENRDSNEKNKKKISYKYDRKLLSATATGTPTTAKKKKKKNYPDGNFLEFYSDTCLLGAMDA